MAGTIARRMQQTKACLAAAKFAVRYDYGGPGAVQWYPCDANGIMTGDALPRRECETLWRVGALQWHAKISENVAMYAYAPGA